ncbi:AAA family ATPase [Aurantiacibacter hainanensis]|uniref:AAA family ATPase n=1 Tax=Aurantiacibacter hainanensis TaxID=3076114 RepID=UPI0030C697A8
MKDILDIYPSKAGGNAPRTLIAAESRWTARVADEVGQVVPSLHVENLGLGENLSRERLRECELLVLEVDANEHASLDRLTAIKRSHSHLAIIAAVSNADLQVMRTLLRHGVSDVVALPFDLGELTGEIINIGAKLAEHSETSLAPSLSFAGALGRSGTTSIMLHLAHELVRQSDGPFRCCLIDLDLQSGELAAHAGMETPRSILSLLEAGERLDQDMVRNVASRQDEGVYIISAPSEILPLEQVDVDQALRIIGLARAEFDLVLIDMPPAWSNFSLSAAADSDRIFLITEQSLSHLRQARRCLDLFREVGVRKGKVQIVVNRATKGRFRNISVQDVADTLGAEVVGTIRDDKGELAQAIDQGRLVDTISRRNVFYRDVAELAEKVGNMLSGDRS